MVTGQTSEYDTSDIANMRVILNFMKIFFAILNIFQNFILHFIIGR